MLLDVRRKSLLAVKPVYNPRASLNLEDHDPLVRGPTTPSMHI